MYNSQNLAKAVLNVNHPCSKNMLCGGIIVCNDKLWIIDRSGSIFVCDPSDLNIEMKYYAKEQSLLLDIVCIEHKGKLIYVDKRKKRINVFDTKELSMSTVDLSNHFESSTDIGFYSTYKDKLLIFNTKVSYVISYGIGNDQLDVTMLKGSGLGETIICGNRETENIFLLTDKSILKYDFEERKLIKVGQSEEMTLDCKLFEDGFLLLKKNGYIHKWTEGQAEELYCNNISGSYSFLIINKDKIFLFPDEAGSIVEIDKKNNCIREISYPNDMKFYDETWKKFATYCESDDFFWINNRSSNVSVRIDKSSNIVEFYSFIELDESKRFLLYKNNNVCTIKESELSLDGFIKMINWEM